MFIDVNISCQITRRFKLYSIVFIGCPLLHSSVGEFLEAIWTLNGPRTGLHVEVTGSHITQGQSSTSRLEERREGN